MLFIEYRCRIGAGTGSYSTKKVRLLHKNIQICQRPGWGGGGWKYFRLLSDLKPVKTVIFYNFIPCSRSCKSVKCLATLNNFLDPTFVRFESTVHFLLVLTVFCINGFLSCLPQVYNKLTKGVLLFKT
jgi:hypothetical protein